MFLSLDISCVYSVPGKPDGRYKLWLFREPQGEAAIAVLTAVPSDPGPGILPRLERLCNGLVASFNLSRDHTMFFARLVFLAPRKGTGGNATIERIDELVFSRLGDRLVDPERHSSSRAAVEALAVASLPGIEFEEVHPSDPWSKP